RRRGWVARGRPWGRRRGGRGRGRPWWHRRRRGEPRRRGRQQGRHGRQRHRRRWTMIIGARLSTRLRLPLAALALFSLSLPIDAHARKRRGGAHKVERRIDKGSPGSKGSPTPAAADEADEDDTGSATAREQGPGGSDDDARGDAATHSAVAGDGDGEAKTER